MDKVFEQDRAALEFFRRRKFVLTAITVLFFHLAVGLLYSRPQFYPDVIGVILKPFQHVLHSGVINVYKFSMNYYTGNPLFLLPPLLAFGSSPGLVRFLLVFSMALASMFAFASYRNIFGYRRGLVAVLVLFSMNLWLVFRYVDYAYTVLFSTALLYLFTAYYERGSERAGYLLALFSGIFFYFKAIIAYTVAGLFSGYVSDKGWRFWEETGLDLRRAAFLFLIGMTPFLVYSLWSDFYYFEAVLTVSSNYEPSMSLLDILVSRWKHINYVLDPTAFLGSSFSMMPNIFSVLLLTGGVLSVTRNRRRLYTVCFIVIGALTLYVTNLITYRQVVLMMPLAPVIMLSNLEIGDLDSKHKDFAVGIILFLSICISVSGFGERASTHFSIDGANKIGLAPGDFQDYQELRRGEITATNAYRPYALSMYELRRTPMLFLTPTINDEGGNYMLDDHRYRLEELPESKNITLVLYTEDYCSSYRDEICGYSTEEIKQSYNLSRYEPRRQIIGNQEFLVYNIRTA